MYTKTRKIIATMLVLMITITHFNVIGEVLATNLESQNIQTNVEHVELNEITTNVEEQAELNMQISKYIPYDINGNKGVVVQTVLQSYLKDNTLPVQENKIEILVPSINGVKPQQVKVMANTTKATNGDERGEEFSQENYIYDSENDKLTITVKNKEKESDKVSWKKEAKDEFVVTYIYPETAIASEEVKILVKANSELTIYGETKTKSSKTIEEEVTLKEQISNLVDFSVNTNIENISKGQIYANYQVDNKVETEYQQIITANVTMANLTDKIVLEQNVDNFITKENKKLEATQTYYKKVIVNQKEFNKIIGTEGKISLYSGTTPIAKINKDTLASEQGELIVDLSELNINSLNIETSKPQTEGKITIKIIKAIKGDVGLTKTQMVDVNKFEVKLMGKVVNGNTNFEEQEITKEITFTEPTSQAELLIDNNRLSTVVINENVKITAKLKTDTLDCKLYTNPTLKITMPNYIENINVKNIEVLFDTEGSKLTLKPNDNRIIQNAEGTKIILIDLEGTQTEYTLGAVSKGINVVVTADIVVNKFTPNKQDQIKMTYTNKNIITNTKTILEETNETATQINVVAPVGVITTTTISNYKENAESVTSISGEEKSAVIPILSEERIANLSMEVINNYNNTIDNITILGRTMFKGNKDILTEKDLGTTVNMPLTSNIVLNGVDADKVAIYYSENGEATKDLSLESNGWTLVPSRLENVKSYLIVLTDYSVNTGEKFNFNYKIKIPENLQHNEYAYENYVVYFNNNLESGMIKDKQASTKVGVTTGKGPIIKATMTSNIDENTEVLEGRIIKYKLTVQNIGTHLAKEVKATVNLPQYMSYIIEDTSSTLGYSYSTDTQPNIEFGNLEGGESITKEIWVQVGKLYEDDICKEESHYITSENGRKYHSKEYKHENSDYTVKAEIKADITASNLSKTIQSTEAVNTITKSYFTTSVIGNGENHNYIKAGTTYIYRVSIKSTDRNIDRKNTKITVVLPEELKYQEIKLEQYNEEKVDYEDITEQANVKYNKQTNTITVNIGNVNGDYERDLYVKTIVQELPEGIYEKQVEIKATVVADNVKEEQIDTLKEKVHKLGLEVTQTANIPENTKISTDEDFKYIFTVKNLSSIPVEDITITDILPKEVTYVNGKIIYSDDTVKSFSSKNTEGHPEIKLDLKENETVRIEINVIANLLEKETSIENKATVVQNEIGTIETNTLTHIIEAFEGTIDLEEESVKRISGLVWIDENKDGIRNENEEKVSNIQVMLFDNRTGKLIADENGSAIIKTTDENGIYTFENVSQGNYTVIFLYDTANYSATTYQVEEAGSERNSDAVDTKITLDGITRMAAITENVNISTQNVYNIDLGIIENPKFDLKIDKTVGKIIVQNSTGTTEYNYNDSKLAKRELVGKYVNETTLVVEYKIKVTNEGAVDAYVKKIADYIPTGLKFSAELNRDWYSTQNGIILNSSLANTKIAPGEAKEVKLTLTMNVTEQNLGLISNNAEIYEAYNNLGLKDIDSTEANQVLGEDDISIADILITIKTGETILFIGLSISIISIIGIGAYFIKKKVLR